MYVFKQSISEERSALCLIWFEGGHQEFVFYGQTINSEKILNSACSIPGSFSAPTAPSIQPVKPNETDTTISQTSLTCPSTSPSGDVWREPVPQTSLPGIQESVLPITAHNPRTELYSGIHFLLSSLLAMSHGSSLIYKTRVVPCTLEAELQITLQETKNAD